MKKIISISTKLIIIYLIGVNLFFNKNSALTEETKNTTFEEYIKKIPTDKFYILGTGDLLKIEVSEEAEELNQVVRIDGKGTVFLKRLKTIFIKGLTIKELTEILNKEYSKYVISPEVQLTILQYRPVKVYVDGEIENPGIHVLPGASSPINTLEAFQTDNGLVSNNDFSGDDLSLNNNVFFPSLIDALRISGGITISADLENINITRINNISNGGGRVSTKINLLETLELRDLSQNIRILDGDTITVFTNEKPVVEQITKAIQSNINPKFINVIVGGRVEQPGPVQINKTSSLTDAIEIAGGAKTLKGPLVFLRYKNDGSIDRRKFRLRMGAKRGSFKNPYLRNGDIIYVGKSSLNRFNEVLTEITNPIEGIIQSYGFYKILTE